MNSSLLSDICYVLRRLDKTPGFTILAAVLLLISPITPALAGESELRTYGDPSLRTIVDARTRAIYEAASDPGTQRIFLITRGNPMSVRDARGTEVTGTVIAGAISRIIATVWTKDGKYSVEFYRTGETLVMTYETFIFFEESAPPGAWRNFMGLAAWERRVYFDARRNIGYAEARGLQAPAPGTGGEQLQQQAQRLAELLHKSGTAANTETPAPSDPPFVDVKGAFFALSVADIEASAKWYREKLDLAVNMRTKSGKATVIVLSGNGLTVELIRQDEATDLGKDALLAHGFFKAGLVVENLDRTIAELKARNVQIAYGPYPARGNAMSNFIIRDNAGNLVQFFGK